MDGERSFSIVDEPLVNTTGRNRSPMKRLRMAARSAFERRVVISRTHGVAWTRTGRHPLFAGGNADGDVEMLSSARFGLLIHHDDAEREFAYDAGAERALAEAKARGWTVVSMKDDFATVFEGVSPIQSAVGGRP